MTPEQILKTKFNLPTEVPQKEYFCFYRYVPPGEPGSLIISKNYICFLSTLTHNVTIQIDQITSIKKKRTALVIPTAIQIKIGVVKYFFGSFEKRDETFDFLNQVWEAKKKK